MSVENGAEVQDPVLAQVLAWQRQGTELRAKLLDEKEALLRRLGEIDAALAVIPAPLGADAPTRRSDSPDLDDQRDAARPAAPLRLPMPASAFKKLSMPQMVRAIILDHPEGIRATQVVETIRLVNSKVDPALVHSGLYRNLESRAIKADGNRGTRIYYPGELSTEDSVDE